MIARSFVLPLVLALLAGCGEPAREMPSDLLQPPALGHWKSVVLPGGGEIRIEPNLLTLQSGKPMTVARFDGWEALKLPLTDYEVTFEAQRVEGNDLFAALTFPVRDVKTSATLVLGGWGGALTGISSIDDQDASENSTRSEQHFVNGQWYKIRLRVTNDEIHAWIDDRLVVNTSIKGRKISLRPGDIELSAPFGFATYGTKGQVRGLTVWHLFPL